MRITLIDLKVNLLKEYNFDMKKKYLVEFTLHDGSKEEVELITDRLEWSLEQWSRNRAVASHQIIEEGTTNKKNMLFG